MPMIRVSLAMWALPVRLLKSFHAVMCPSADTRSPGACSSSPLMPTASIVPTNSCPVMIPTGMRPAAHASHSQMCRSVPQMPTFLTLISTSRGPGVGTTRSSLNCNSGPAWCLIRPRMVPPGVGVVPETAGWGAAGLVGIGAPIGEWLGPASNAGAGAFILWIGRTGRSTNRGPPYQLSRTGRNPAHT
jgi:hypothetical protein